MFWDFFSKRELGRVRDELRRLVDDYQSLRREFRELKLESENVWQQTYRLHEKIRKRAARKAEGDGPVEPEMSVDDRIRKGLPPHAPITQHQP